MCDKRNLTTLHSYAYMLFNRLVILFLHRLVHGQGVTINRDKKLATHIHTHSYDYWINICDYLAVSAHLKCTLNQRGHRTDKLSKTWDLFVYYNYCTMIQICVFHTALCQLTSRKFDLNFLFIDGTA